MALHLIVREAVSCHDKCYRSAPLLTEPAHCACAGPKRKNLRVRNPEKYHWKPQELLKQLARIYLNLSRADKAGDFVAAIAADQRSYHEGLFVEAAEVRSRHSKRRALSAFADVGRV